MRHAFLDSDCDLLEEGIRASFCANCREEGKKKKCIIPRGSIVHKFRSCLQIWKVHLRRKKNKTKYTTATLAAEGVSIHEMIFKKLEDRAVRSQSWNCE